MTDQNQINIQSTFTEQEKRLLHDIARKAIMASVHGDKPPELPEVPESLKQKAGAFVSLHRRGALRGCIGTLYPDKPLYRTVQEMAQAAALHDPRFDPLDPDELNDLDIEISVLTPLQPVTSIEEIEVGKHGLMIVRGHYSGLLLPQVATQYGWDRIAFLQHTCLKAGLPPDAWQDPESKLFIFSADVF
ncbi:MAG: AmmeMemoRadiSam system protein A [Desulfobacterota bacterium]|nr:AmmeMemoRadiSam system protein A [Thermodesulfobacteriota bacterium]